MLLANSGLFMQTIHCPYTHHEMSHCAHNVRGQSDRISRMVALKIQYYLCPHLSVQWPAESAADPLKS